MFKNIKRILDIYFSLCLSKTVIEMKVAHIIYLDLNVRTDRTQAQLGFQRIKIYTKGVSFMSKKLIKPRFAFVFPQRIIFKDDFFVPDEDCIIYEWRDGKYHVFCNVIYGEF